MRLYRVRRPARARFIPPLAAMLLGAGLSPAMPGAAARAQGIIITGATSARLIDLRPLVLDSVPYAATSDWGALRITSDSVIVTCTQGDPWCRFGRSGTTTNLVALMQDLDIVGWGLGRGVSVHAQLRGRSAMGAGRDLWPQANESFEALAAYIEMDRDRFRVRGGRQYIASNLGYYNFDGGELLWRVVPPLSAEVYGGWTLLQGFAKPVTDEAMAAVEDLAPDRRGQLVGGMMRFGFGAIGSLRAQYQREISSDRAGLYSERLAVDGETPFGIGMLSAAMARDLATGRYNELRLRYGVSLPQQLSAAVEARHYEPFFDLWTIWGAFSPVGYDEQKAQVGWNGFGGDLQLGASGGYRRYNATNTGVASLPLRTDGWRLGLNGSWRPATQWTLDGSYGMDVGFGASRSDADAAVRWAPGDRFDIAVRGAALQDIYEFRVGTGRVLGAGVDLGWQLSPALRFAGDAMLYRQTAQQQPSVADWNQWRGGVRLEWTVGNEPGVVPAGRPQ